MTDIYNADASEDEREAFMEELEKLHTPVSTPGDEAAIRHALTLHHIAKGVARYYLPTRIREEAEAALDRLMAAPTAAQRERDALVRMLDLFGAPTTAYNPYEGGEDELNLVGRLTHLIDPHNEGLEGWKRRLAAEAQVESLTRERDEWREIAVRLEALKK